MATAREECERAFESLVGHSPSSVVYMGAWTTGPLEVGAYVEWVEVATAEGAWFRFTTEPDFGDHGVFVFPGPVERADALKTADAAALPPWRQVLGKRIVSASVLWRPLMYSGAALSGEAPVYPRDVAFAFEDGAILVLSAASVDADGEVVLGVDSVRAFTGEQARALGMLGPPQ